MKRSILGLATLTLLLGGVSQTRADLITNGGFESGDFTPGWTANVQIVTFVTGTFDGFNPHSGSFFAALGDQGSLGTLSQTISDTSGQNYTLNMYLGSDGETTNEFKVEWNGNVLYDQTNIPSTGGGYNLLSFTVQGTGSDTLTLFERNDFGWLALDDVSLTPNSTPPPSVPEPATLTLLGLGIVSLGCYSWRRRRQRS